MPRCLICPHALAGKTSTPRSSRSRRAGGRRRKKTCRRPGTPQAEIRLSRGLKDAFPSLRRDGNPSLWRGAYPSLRQAEIRPLIKTTLEKLRRKKKGATRASAREGAVLPSCGERMNDFRSAAAGELLPSSPAAMPPPSEREADVTACGGHCVARSDVAIRSFVLSPSLVPRPP